MYHGVTVLAGPARCGKTSRLLADYRRALADGPMGSALWLAPSRRAAWDIRARLFDGPLRGCFLPQCLTFGQFGQLVVESSARPDRPIDRVMSRQLLRRLVAESVEQGRLDYFGPIAHTAGFLDLVADFVAELKRLEIRPDELAAACHEDGMTTKDRELWTLYHDYQAVLGKHRLYDIEGRFWLARALLREGQRRPFERLRHVFVDGFTDFTRTEYEVLEILGARIESLAVTLLWEDDPRREDLFGKCSHTLAELGRRFPRLEVQQIKRPADVGPPALGYLETHLFENRRVRDDVVAPDGLEIVAAAGQVREIEFIGARIKRLLCQGDASAPGQPVRPGDVLVLFRSLAESAELVRETFGEMGIPYAISSPRGLDQSPLVSALLALLRLECDGWPFRQLLAVLNHNYVRPDSPEWQTGLAVADEIVREAQVPSGRKEVLEQIERWAANDDQAENGKPLSQRVLERRQRAAVALPLLARLAETLAELPHRATMVRWVAAVERLAEVSGLLKSARRDAPPGGRDGRDQEAWGLLLAGLRGCERLAEWVGQPQPELTMRELLDVIQDVRHGASLPADFEEPGRVRVLTVGEARSLSAPYVFLAGLSEQAFPAADREDRVYGESEYRRLHERGLPFPLRADRSGQEMLLFYEAATRAQRRLVFSYSALDDKAQPLSPSPYLLEVERVFGRRLRPIEDLQLSPVPETSDVVSPRDLRVKAVATVLEGDASLLGTVFRHEPVRGAAETLCAGLRVAQERRMGNTFGSFEGVFTGTAAIERLSARFGPAYCWSATQLERYALCPYRFFLERVLGIEPFEQPELEVDYRTRGRMLHGALATLHRRTNARAGEPASPCHAEEGEFLREVNEVLEAQLAGLRSGRPLNNVLREIDARVLTGLIAEYQDQHRGYDANWNDCDEPLRPTHFEVSFGHQLDDLDEVDLELGWKDSLSTPIPFELDCPEGTVLISGRIDRIDVGSVAGHKIFNVVDYKSGKPQKFDDEAVASGRALQLPLYVLAVEALLMRGQQAVPWSAAYWYVQEAGCGKLIRFADSQDNQLHETAAWRSLKQAVLERVRAVVTGIRQAQFPMYSADEKCTSYCPYHTVCRVRQTRVLNKQWPPPAKRS